MGAVDGGFPSTYTPGASTIRDTCYEPLWTPAFGCNHDRMLNCNGSPAPGLDETYVGDGGGQYHVTFELEAGEETEGAVHINFANYTDDCTKGVTMSGHQQAIVDVSTFNGWVTGVWNTTLAPVAMAGCSMIW